MRDWASFRDFVKNPLVDQIKKLRHDRKYRDVAFLQGPQQLRGVKSFEITDASALYQRQHQIGHQSENVKHRQHTQESIARTNIDPIEYRFHFGKQVGMREHDALRVGGRARGVKQSREFIPGGWMTLEWSWPALDNCIQGS